MCRTERPALVLNPAEKSVVAKLAKSDGGPPQVALVRRLNRHAARNRAIWPQDKHWHVARHGQGVRHG